ncbi:MAG: hypothetical protein V1708_01150 [Candidatus Micrarchaeota archaeon]
MKTKTKRKLVVGAAAGFLAANVIAGAIFKHIDSKEPPTPTTLTELLKTTPPDSLTNRIEHDGVEVITQTKVPTTRLRAIASEVALVRPILGGQTPIIFFNTPDFLRRLVIPNASRYEMEYNLTSRNIVASTGNFAKPESILIPEMFHEAAHAVFNDSKNQDDLKRVFDSARAKYGAKDTEGHLIFSIFDETHYRDFSPYLNEPWRFGHPYSKPAELFASASAVMRHDAPKFIRAMRQIAVEDSARHGLALKVARTVLGYYQGHEESIFPKSVLDYVRAKPESLRVKERERK